MKHFSKWGLAFLLCAGYASAQLVGPVSITSTQCAAISTDQAATVAVFALGTWTGTLQPQATIQGQTAFNVQVTPSTSSTAQNTITANGAFVLAVAGYSTFQLCGNTVASGTANVYLNVSQAQLGSAAGAGGGGSGTVTSVGLTLNTAATCGAAAVTGSPVTTTGTLNINFVGVNGDVLTFNGSNCPVDSGTLLSSLVVSGGALGTPSSGTLTNATGLPLNGLVGANAAATLTESAVSRPITFAGVETANLTYPIVFQNTNSANNNTSGALLANCAGSDNAPTCFMINNTTAITGLLASFNTGGTVTNGVISGQTPQWSVTAGGAVTEANSLTVSAGTITAPAGTVTGPPSYAFAGDTAGAGFYRAGSAVYGITNGTNEVLRLQATGVKGVSGGCYGMTASSSSSTGAFDTGMGRSAAGVFSFNGDTACGDTTGKLKAAGYISVGTKFTSNAGCTEGTLVGGATAGKFTVGQGTACTIIITMGNTATAPNGWTCMAYDQTAVPAVAIRQTASTTTTCSLLMTVATSDVITFAAIGY